MADSSTDNAQNGLTATSMSGLVLARLWYVASAFLTIKQDDEAGHAGNGSCAGDDAEPRPGARVWY
jgi:hypothetical protein